MGDQQTDQRPNGKRYRSPPLRLVGNPFKDLDPAQKDLLMVAIAGNLVSVIVEDYLAEETGSETPPEQGDRPCT